MTSRSPNPSLLPARIPRGALEIAMKKAAEAVSNEGHYGFAHPMNGRGFEWRPDICPGCVASIVRAVATHEVLYV